MKIELPFTYMVSATTSRWKTAKRVVQLDFVAWDVPEVALADAPLALEWVHVVCDPLAQDRGQSFRREVRFVDGAFYTPFGTTGPRADYYMTFLAENLPRRDNAYHTTLRHFWDLLPHETNDPRMKALEEWFYGCSFSSELDGKNDVRIVSSDEDAERKWAEASASRFAVIDGRAYIRVGEPKLVFNVWQFPVPGAGISMTFTSENFVSAIDGDTLGSPARRLHFRADDFSCMEDHSMVKGVPMIREEVQNVVVHMPQTLGFNAARELAYRTALFAHSAGEPALGAIGRDAANAWYDLKDALTRFRADGNWHVLEEEMTQAIPVLVEGMRASAQGAVAELEECFDIWSASEIALEISHPYPKPSF